MAGVIKWTGVWKIRVPYDNDLRVSHARGPLAVRGIISGYYCFARLCNKAGAFDPTSRSCGRCKEHHARDVTSKEIKQNRIENSTT